MAKPGQCVLLDVREQWEFTRGHARDAKNVPLSQFGRRMGEIPIDRDVLVICQSGSRSMQAARVLHTRGHTRIFTVKGGMTMWQLHGLPMA